MTGLYNVYIGENEEIMCASCALQYEGELGNSSSLSDGEMVACDMDYLGCEGYIKG